MKKKLLCITLLLVMLVNLNMAFAWEVEDPYSINSYDEEVILLTL